MTEQMDGQLSFFDLVSPCRRTSPEPSQATKAATSGRSSKPSAGLKTQTLLFLNLRRDGGNMLGASWELATALPGVCTTLNTGEFPSDARESTLSQILVLNAPEKYSLSAKACAGILRRAEKRGKVLPDMLRDALMEVVGVGG